jgi:AraC-like DNA-binding protein
VHTETLATVVPDNSVRFIGHETHSHDAPHLVYVVSGTAHLIVERTPVTLQAAESVWLAPHVPHSARYEDGTCVLGPLLEPEASPPGEMLVLGPSAEVGTVITSILVAAPHTEEQIAVFRQALSRALTSHIGCLFTVPEPAHPVVRRLAGEARESWYDLDTLAHRHHMSRRQVQRIFVTETGLTFSQWRTRVRLNGAAQSLLAGQSLSAAAHRSGYSSSAKLLQALSRECQVPQDDLRRDPREAVQRCLARRGTI